MILLMLCCDLSIERSLSRFCFGAAATQVKTHRVMVLSVRAVETHNDVRLFDAEEPVLLLELKPPSPAMKKKLARAKESQGPEASETKIETARSEQSDQFGDADLQEGYDFLLDDAESRAVEEEDADDGENAAENALAQSAMSRAVSEGRPGTHSASDDVEGSAEAYIASADHLGHPLPNFTTPACDLKRLKRAAIMDAGRDRRSRSGSSAKPSQAPGPQPPGPQPPPGPPPFWRLSRSASDHSVVPVTPPKTPPIAPPKTPPAAPKTAPTAAPSKPRPRNPRPSRPNWLAAKSPATS